MKRAYSTLAAGVLFGALLGYVVLSRPGPSTSTLGPVIWTFAPEQVRRVLVEQAGQPTVELERDGDHWRIVQPRPVPAGDEAVEGLLSSLASLRGRRLIAEQPGKAEEFGLEPPRALLTLTMTDGTAKRLQVGSETPLAQGEPGYYVRDEARPPVYTLDAYTVEPVTGSWEYFRDRELVKVAADDVTGVRIEGRDRAIEARRAASPQSAPADRRWRLVTPYEAPGDPSRIERVLGDLRFTRIDRFVSDAPSAGELQSYGLREPVAQVRLTTASGEVALRVGGLASEGGRYVQMEGLPSVYTVPESDLESLLSATAESWIRRKVLGLSADELRRLSFTMTGREGPVQLEQKADGSWRLMPGDRPVDEEEARAFLEALTALESEHVELDGRGAADTARNGTGGGVIELTAAGHGDVPVTRIEIPVVDGPEAAGGSDEQAENGAGDRLVRVTQGSDRLVYRVSRVSLKEVESQVAEWMALPPSSASQDGS